MRKIFALLALLSLQNLAKAQTFYDEGTIQNIEITFAQSNWDALLDAEKNGSQNYIMATSISINGTVFDSIGVKYKGNSTYNANQTKNPFHIELDTYKDHIYENYTDIKLSNVAKDPSFIREVLGYKLLRNYMDAPLSNYANVYVNGTLIGLYANSESISKKFVDSRFGSKKNAFVKCNPPAGAGPGVSDLPYLTYSGTDSTIAHYADAYEIKSDFGWEELINLCDSLGNNITDIEDILDVDRALWMLAFNNIAVNLDSYIGGFAQNYYLYRDDYGRFMPVVWDLNESFGTFSSTGSGNLNSTAAKQQMDILLHENDATYPLVSMLMSVPTYKKAYLAHCKTFLTENFTNNGVYYTEGQALQTTIDAAVQADANKFYTYNNFTSNITTDITSGGGQSTPGITNLMNGRYSHLMSQSEFTATEPTISNLVVSNATPNLGETIDFTANVINENVVYLRFRTETMAPFTEVEMFDDGLHNDGAAGDDVFGADAVMTGAWMEYYFYAENADIGKFSPTNAEHEFYTLNMNTTLTAEDLVINEFMASNDAIQADQDGEFDDWIEIFNKSNVIVDISGYGLSDDITKLNEFSFPAGTIIGANDYIVVWADKDLLQAGYHADFKLSSLGESIYLTNAAVNIIDSVAFGSQYTDVSHGRLPNGTGSFYNLNPTFGAENSEINYTGIPNVDNDISFRVYPNPTSKSFYVELDQFQSQEIQVAIYDFNGRLMYSNSISKSVSINTTQWSSGVYLVQVDSKTTKLIVE
ncbi:MAG: hypothetical protein ACI9N1_000479 [Flavobacteriales bacterium]|jgi:hypothetical protein